MQQIIHTIALALILIGSVGTLICSIILIVLLRDNRKDTTSPD